MTPAVDGTSDAPSAAVDPAFVDLFDREFPAITRTVAVVTGDRELAADVTQEAFARAFSRWRTVGRYDRPGAWVRRVAIRLAMRAVRRDRRPEALEEASVTVPGSRDLDLERAVATLPGKQRAAITLHYFDDLPVRDVAAHLGCSEATAKVHLHRARVRLATILGEDPA